MEQRELFQNSKQCLLNTETERIELWENFVPNQNELYESLKKSLNWKQDEISLYGKVHPVPRLQAWYGESGQEYSYSGIDLKPNAFNQELFSLKEKVESKLTLPFNSLLANFYRDGRDCVSWHSDDEPELGKNPCIASLSLGGSRKFQLKNKIDGKKIEVILKGGSLLVMSGQVQHNWLHQVPRSKTLTEPRINLTFRKIIA